MIFFRTLRTESGISRSACDGPFLTEWDFNQMLMKHFFPNDGPVWKQLFYRAHTLPVLQHHPAVFTHGKLQRENIILYFGEDLSFTITILDWEFAG